MVSSPEKIMLNRLILEALGDTNLSKSLESTPIPVEINDKWLWIQPYFITTKMSGKGDTKVEVSDDDADFRRFKNPDTPFVLLGYDPVNDIFAIWNPSVVKHALNIKHKINFPCKMGLQRKAANADQEVVEVLPAVAKVCCCRRTLLRDVLCRLGEIFTDIPSWAEAQPVLNEKLSFEILCDKNNLPEFLQYLSNDGIKNPIQYINNIKRLFKDGFFDNEEVKKTFELFKSVSQYGEAIEILHKQGYLDRYVLFNKRQGREYNYMATMLRKYVTFLCWKVFQSSNAIDIPLEGRYAGNIAKHSKVRIVYPNGDSVSLRPIDALVKVVLETGPDKVSELGIECSIKLHKPLVTQNPEQNDKGKNKYHSELCEGWFVFNKGTAKETIDTINKISDDLGLGIRADLIRAIKEKDFIYYKKGDTSNS